MPKKTDIAGLVSLITTDLRGIVSDEIALAKAEIKPALTRLVGGGALFIGAAALAALAGLFVGLGVVVAFAWLFAAQTSLSAWVCGLLGLACAIVLFLLIAGLLALLGYRQVKSARAPELTPASARQAIEAVQAGFERGLGVVNGELEDQPVILL
ncbi:MAG: phage holin family protein [Propionibacteriaceae bacterium]|jgi:membrane protein implicated in regulation of membrane protease activity|nr:phage holin family protein [Propionibacteriaceae bacterium]